MKLGVSDDDSFSVSRAGDAESRYEISNQVFSADDAAAARNYGLGDAPFPEYFRDETNVATSRILSHSAAKQDLQNGGVYPDFVNFDVNDLTTLPVIVTNSKPSVMQIPDPSGAVDGADANTLVSTNVNVDPGVYVNVKVTQNVHQVVDNHVEKDCLVKVANIYDTATRGSGYAVNDLFEITLPAAQYVDDNLESNSRGLKAVPVVVKVKKVWMDLLVTGMHQQLLMPLRL